MRRNYLAIVCLVIANLLFFEGCSNKDESSITSIQETGIEGVTDESKLDVEMQNRQEFIDMYYPIMLEYYTKTTSLLESIHSFTEFYEQSGHNYSDKNVIEKLDVYYNSICEKHKACDEYLMENEFLSNNILLFEKIFDLYLYDKITEIVNTIKKDYVDYRKDFLNESIEEGGILESVYDDSFLYIISASFMIIDVSNLPNIDLEPKETCYKRWLEYSSITENEIAQQKLLDAWLNEDSNSSKETDNLTPRLNTQDGGTSNSDLYIGSISDIEYAFVLWSFRDQVVSDLTYTLCDADGDGSNELLINAITDEVNGMYTQLIADSNDKLYHYRGYTPTGAAASSNFCILKGYDTILWNTDYSTIAYVESQYYQWTGSIWKEIKELNGISFDYENKVEFDCPNVLNIGVVGNSKEVFDEIDEYFNNRGGAYSAGEADLDGDGQIEKVYYVLAAANAWYETLYMDNTTDNQSFQDHRDIYMTVVIADKIEDGVVLRPVRVKYRGSNIEIIDDTLYINNVAYAYTDTQSQYTTPCIQTVLKSPGTYGDFDSKGNRTIYSMLYMPFYDIGKMCTDISLNHDGSNYVTARLGNSRCAFKFLLVTKNSLTSASPAYMVEVDSYHTVTGDGTIDDIPIIGDFCMGDSIGELKTIMIPSTKWKPLLFGQSYLAYTNFYYRPSYENENVFFVEVWTDGEGEDSKVCKIRFEQIFSINDEIKEALGLH